MRLSYSRLLIGAAVLITAAAAVCAQQHEPRQAKTLSVQLGDKVILVPDPEGFEEATSQFPRFKERMKATEALENDMLLSHMPVSDCDLMRKGVKPTYDFFTKVSVLKGARELTASREIMAVAVDSFRKNFDAIVDPNDPDMKQLDKHAEEELSRIDAKETKVDLLNPKLLGEFDRRPDVNSFLVFLTTKIKSGEAEEITPSLVTASFVRVNERIIYVYAFMKYRSKADANTIKQFSTKWINSIVAANRGAQ